MMKPIIAASVAAGLLLPIRPALYVPSAPAIVKADNIKPHGLLSIPVPVGVAAAMKRADPAFLSRVSGGMGQILASATWVHRIEDNATCLIVVAGFQHTTASLDPMTATVGGQSMSSAVSEGTASFRATIFYLFNPPKGLQTIVVTPATTSNRALGGGSITVSNAASIDASGSVSGTTTGTVSLSTTKRTLIVAGVTSSTGGTATYTNTMTSPASATTQFEPAITALVRRSLAGYTTPVQAAGTIDVTVTPSVSSTALRLCAIALAA